MMDRLFAEVRLLRSLWHEKIIALDKVWTDDKSNTNTLNFIAEFCTSGNLREYRKRHSQVPIKALEKWSRQILKGLEYLHNHESCIIRHDLNCSNVLINGDAGQAKIRDLGLATVVEKNYTAHSILRTPEFMAPELYEEDYTELVDIYYFGICVLEMATRQIPSSASYVSDAPATLQSPPPQRHPRPSSSAVAANIDRLPAASLTAPPN